MSTDKQHQHQQSRKKSQWKRFSKLICNPKTFFLVFKLISAIDNVFKLLKWLEDFFKDD
jgi:hypothetical protein